MQLVHLARGVAGGRETWGGEAKGTAEVGGVGRSPSAGCSGEGKYGAAVTAGDGQNPAQEAEFKSITHSLPSL